MDSRETSQSAAHTSTELQGAREQLERFIQNVAAIAGAANRQMKKLVWVSAISSLLLAGLAYDWVTTQGVILIVSVVVAFIPLVLLLKLRLALSNVSSLPDDFHHLESSISNLVGELKARGLIEQIKALWAEESKTMLGRVRFLVKCAPILSKMKNVVEGLSAAGALTTTFAVVSPGFAGLAGLTAGLVMIWAIAAVLLGIAWLVF